jgi:tetratricopeptide (TPR) repeat protein
MLRLATPLWVRGETERTLAIVAEAVALLEREPPGPELANAYNRMGSRTLFQGNAQEGLRWSEQAVSLARELGIGDDLADALQVRGMARCELGDRGGLEDLREALRMALDLVPGDRRLERPREPEVLGLDERGPGPWPRDPSCGHPVRRAARSPRVRFLGQGGKLLDAL